MDRTLLYWRIPSSILWVLTGVVVTALGLRFGMRLIGVRGDTAFPGFVYSTTASLVQPFYRFFPTSDRLDYRAVEVASLVAAGVLVAGALAVYAVGLLITLREPLDGADLSSSG